MEEEFVLKKIVKYGGLVFIGLVISRLLAYATRLYLARTLSPEGYGLLFLGISLFTLLSTFHILGLNRAIQRYVSVFLGQGDERRIKGVIISSFTISLPLSLLLAAFLFLFADWISLTFFTPALAPILKIFSLMFPLTILLDVSNFTSIGFQKIQYQVYSERVAKQLITFAFIAVLLHAGFGITGGALGYVLGLLFSAVLAFTFLERKVFPFLRTSTAAVPLKKELLAFSIPIFFADLLDTLVRTLSTIMLGSLATVRDVGIYQVAHPSSQLITIVPIALTSLFIPIISKMHSEGKKGEITTLYKTLSKWVFYVSLPVMVFFLLFPNAFLNTLFGSQYVDGAAALGVLALGFMVIAFSELSLGILDTMKKTTYHFINSVVAVAVNIVLNYILIQQFGVMGAAVATTATFILIAALRTVESYWFIGVLPVSRGFLKAIAAVALSGGFVYSATQFPLGYPLHVMVTFGFLFFFLYGLLLLVLRGFEPNDFIILRELERKTGMRIGFLRRFIKRFV